MKSKFIVATLFSMLFCSTASFSADVSSHEEKGVGKFSGMQKVRVDLSELVEKSTISGFTETLSCGLVDLSKNYNSTDSFGDEMAKTRSTANWLEKWKLLKIASLFGSAEAVELCKKAIESKQYSRDCADCLIAGYEDSYDLKEVRAFFWEHLAFVDEQEKEGLIKAYSEGVLVPLNRERIEFWRKYRMS